MLKEGTYSARARGMAGFVGVTLTVADNKISTVDLDLSTETPQYGQKAEKTLNPITYLKNKFNNKVVKGIQEAHASFIAIITRFK